MQEITLIPMQRTCNNMFQIASIWAYCLDRGLELKIDWNHCPTAEELLKEIGATFKKDTLTIGTPIMDVCTLEPYPLPEVDGSFKGMRGWFQDPRYFIGHEQDIRNLYKPLTGEPKPGTLGVHIRLGDYLSSQYEKDYFTLSKEDILKSYDLLGSPSDVEIILFTDEEEEAKKRMPWSDYTISSASTPFDVLREMSSCEYLIASNSTLAWWAAWLGNIRNVAVHYPWTKFHNQHGLYLPHWKTYK